MRAAQINCLRGEVKVYHFYSILIGRNLRIFLKFNWSKFVQKIVEDKFLKKVSGMLADAPDHLWEHIHTERKYVCVKIENLLDDKIPGSFFQSFFCLENCAGFDCTPAEEGSLRELSTKLILDTIKQEAMKQISYIDIKLKKRCAFLCLK